MTQEIDAGGEAGSESPFDGPHVVGTTPGTVTIECPHCGFEGYVPKHRYHDSNIAVCDICSGEVDL